jgi:1-acyl-sn-glycerol-3-phosphate acyltransferase
MAEGDPGRDRAPSLERAVLDEVQGLLGDLGITRSPDIAPASDLTDEIGLDSLGVVELYDRLERRFGIVLSEETLAGARTVADFAAAVAHAQRTATGSRSRTVASDDHQRGGSWPKDASSLLDVLDWHCEEHPDLIQLRILSAADVDPEEISYGILRAEAGRVAGGLLARGLPPGGRVALMLPTGRDYFTASVGIMLAGGVPVPLYPPGRPADLGAHLARHARILQNAGAGLLIVSSEIARDGIEATSSGERSIDLATVADLQEGHGPEVPSMPSDPDQLALIQYTSGSTGEPKGVALSHAQVLADVRSMGEAMEASPEDVFVSWLPLYHDMGLIGTWHTSLYFGMSLVLMSPLTFLARPASWLEAISIFGGTIAAAPNFAYEMCVDRVSRTQASALDLSTWRVACNGSEQVSAQTIRRFADHFSVSGFHPEAMCPAYGLAEVGVGLAISPLGRGPMIEVISRPRLQGDGIAEPVSPDDPDALEVVSSGLPFPGFEIRVTDASGAPLPDRIEGAVVCRGPSAIVGYYENPGASENLWRHGWLSTGDLGYLVEGEIYLTGREKDLVIRGGRNIHPEDLEAVISQIEGVGIEGVAIFGSRDPRHATEQVIAVIEAEEHDARWLDRIRAEALRRSSEVLGTPPDVIVLVTQGSILRTPSGKIRRGATREAFERGELTELEASEAQSSTTSEPPAKRRGLSARGAVTLLFGIYCWAAFFVVAIPWLIGLVLPISLRRRWSLTRWAARALAALVGLDLTVEGVPGDLRRPAILVANHESFADAMVVVLATPGPLRFVTSTEIARSPIVGAVLRRLGCLIIHRDQPDRSHEDVAMMARCAAAGARVVVFPEGSITAPAGIRRFHLGAFQAAAIAGVPIQPLGIHGSRDVVRSGGYRARRAPIQVRFGAALAPGSSEISSVASVAGAARSSVAALARRDVLDGPTEP